ncbi:BSD domain-containing protein [Stachybotrys elegans]|uniref:BSD domain-containing protein n=1 Tax=Stachybotrys elegans TaxID=80388 RepID=A0A8K0SRW6_9HYPO|nr:BSD domain-containing protein [Stachybotrys elegans]
MDLAYDHIQEDAYAKEQAEAKNGAKSDQPQASLEKDLQDAYKAFSASPWGVRIGGFLGNVVKQGESVYTQASKELAEVGEDASKGLNGLRETIVSRTRGLTLTSPTAPADVTKEADDGQVTPTKQTSDESETMLSRLRAEATKRLKDLQKAEDAADEALLKFGTNIRDFLKEAITIAPTDDSAQGSAVLFESKDAQGKRVIHASRFDAQLHVIHTSVESFTKDPASAEYEQWMKEFDVEKKTTDISGDLEKYPELRTTMEKLVPAQIPYADFWKRYYFLRHGIETAEARRRDLLKAASADDEVGWGDDDSDSDSSDSSDSDSDSDSDDETTTDKTAAPAKPKDVAKGASSASSIRTIEPPAQTRLKPEESRKSNDEKSQADSEASYDVVGAASGKTSHAPNSPKESKQADDSDDDWE